MIKLGTTWWRAVLGEMTRIIKDRVQKDHKNANGQTFKHYSKSYEKRKSANKAKRKGESQSSYSTTPDMTLTGRTMADLGVSNITKDGGLIGWSTQGHIIRYLAEMKNYKVVNVGKSNPLGKPELDFFKKQFSKKMSTELKKMSKQYSKTITVNM